MRTRAQIEINGLGNKESGERSLTLPAVIGFVLPFYIIKNQFDQAITVVVVGEGGRREAHYLPVL